MTHYFSTTLPGGGPVEIIPASQMHPGMTAWIECSDGEWREARYETDRFAERWVFPDGLFRHASHSMATPNDPWAVDPDDLEAAIQSITGGTR